MKHVSEGIQMKANIGLQPASADTGESASNKLEYVILSILRHYNGSFNGSLQDWYVVLKPGFPHLADPQELREVFRRFSTDGIIKLTRDKTGSDTVKDDGQLAVEDPFSSSLNPEGVAHWNLNRVRSAPEPAHGRQESSNR
jgi:hypothetical protein